MNQSVNDEGVCRAAPGFGQENSCLKILINRHYEFGNKTMTNFDDQLSVKL